MLSKRIENKVIKHLKTITTSNDWEIIYPGIEARQSIVYRVFSSSYTLEFAVKVYHKEALSSIENQYKALNNLYLSIENTASNYRTPKPYAIYKDDGFYIMEWIQGDNLSNILWRNCLLKEKLQFNIKKGYQWLKKYHARTNLELKKVDISRYSKSIELNIESRGSSEFFNNNSTFIEGTKTLTSFQEEFKGYETYHANLHGDLNLDNIIINNNIISGIDFSSRYHLPIENDIAEMLTHICSNYFLMLPRSDMRYDFSKWEIFNLILDSYKYPRNRKSREFFLFVFLQQILQRWITTKYFHQHNKNNAVIYGIQSNWRLYNCRVITEGLVKYINRKHLT